MMMQHITRVEADIFATHSVNGGQLGSLVRVGSVRFGSVRFGSVRFGSVRFHKRASVNTV